MKFNKILSSALLVVMLFMTIVTALPVTAEAAYSGNNSASASKTAEEITALVKDSYSGKIRYESSQARLDAELPYLDSVEYGDYILYINKYTGGAYYKNKITGQILTSNPYNYLSTESSDKTNQEISSQVIISYSEITVGSERFLYSTPEAAERAQISTDFIKNGIRVNYTLGDTTSRYLLPMAMTADKFEELVLVPMLDKLARLMEEHCGDETGEYNIFVNPKYNVDEDKNSTDKKNVYYYGYLNLSVVRKYLQDAERKYMSMYPSTDDPVRKILAGVKSNIMTLYAAGTNGYTLKNLAEYKEGSSSYENTVRDFYSNESSEIYKTKEAIYVFNINATNNSKSIASTIFRAYAPTYNFIDVNEDEVYCGLVDETDQKPVFRCAIEYTFNSDGSLSVRLPVSSISFDETVYNLSYISVLPYFGSASIAGEGYVFFPDGSGTVAEFKDFYDSTANDNDNANVIVDVYGKDYCYSNITGAHREQITMPVYGIVSEEKSNSCGLDSVSNGFFAIVEEGMALSSLAFDMDVTSMLARAYMMCKPYPSDVYDLSETLSVGGAGQYTIVAEDKFNGSYVTRYTMLTDKNIYAIKGDDIGEFYDTSYVGMANYYRNYLYETGVLTELESVRDNLPLYLEVLGSMEIITKVLSFPVTKKIALTEFDDVTAMYKELRDSVTLLEELAAENKALAATLAEEIAALEKALQEPEADAEKITSQIESKKVLKTEYENIAATYETWSKDFKIDNINFKLTGFGNGGLYNTYPTKLKWNRACGGKRDFKDLLEEVKSAKDKGENFGVYPEYDFMYISYTEMFDGVSKRVNASKMIDNRYASKQLYDSVSREYISYFTLVVNTETLDKLYSKFAKKYSKYDISTISVSTLGSDLNSNFDKDAPVIRDESQSYVESLLDRISNKDGYDVMLDKGNSYTLKYASHILNMNIDSSHFRYSSYPVPFAGMVLHGAVNYTGSPINYSGNPEYELLRAIESGASLYYILCYQNSNYMKEDGLLNQYYGIDYENWYKDIVKNYAELNAAIGELQNYRIVDHKIVIGERVIEPDEAKANIVTLMRELVDMLETKILEAKDNELHAMRDPSNEYYGDLLYVNIDVDSLMEAFAEILNLGNDEIKNYEVENGVTFAQLITAIKTKYENLNPDEARESTDNLLTIDKTYFSDIGGKDNVDDSYSSTKNDYVSAHSFITDSFATDKDYVYTDFTSDKDIVLVTYQNAEGKTVKFLLNYNIYTVEVDLDDGLEAYTLPKYGYVKITG
ncbi:MAG: hypothetical protein IJD79_04925 [Clostridia bacterium]|nr:hypothetical protein [Clostridia bacterium]